MFLICSTIQQDNRPHAILGMAYGQEGFRMMEWPGRDERLLFDSTPTDDATAIATTIASSPSWPRPYNDVMLEHRREHVPRWKTLVSSEATVRSAVRDVLQALQAVNELKKLSDQYEWEQMRALIQAPVLRQDLEIALNTLRGANAFLPLEARQEIGFAWGSCAWRHCGAQADAQEALDELDQLVGVLEPFECQFVLDIVERSLRDVLSVIPSHLQPQPTTRGEKNQWWPSEYQPYQSPPPPTLPDWLFPEE